jgi:hypothetical protein
MFVIDILRFDLEPCAGYAGQARLARQVSMPRQSEFNHLCIGLTTVILIEGKILFVRRANLPRSFRAY